MLCCCVGFRIYQRQKQSSSYFYQSSTDNLFWIYENIGYNIKLPQLSKSKLYLFHKEKHRRHNAAGKLTRIFLACQFKIYRRQVWPKPSRHSGCTAQAVYLCSRAAWQMQSEWRVFYFRSAAIIRFLAQSKWPVKAFHLLVPFLLLVVECVKW